MAVAPYALAFAGKYSVEVLHLHSDYTIANPSPVHDQEHLVAANFVVETLQGLEPAPGLGTNRLCTALDSPGKWLREDPDAFPPHTCVREDYLTGCLPRDVSVSRGQSGLAWWQPDCALQQLTSTQLSSCLASKKLCLMGDSHMRHLYNSVVDLLEGNFGKAAPESKEFRPSNVVSYFEDFWGHASLTGSEGCDVIIRNTGAWHVAWSMSKEGRAKPDLFDYIQRVSNIALGMGLARDKGSQLIWMTTNGQPISLAVHKYKRFEHRDYRIDPMLLAINRVANMHMAVHNITIFDTWSMTNPVADTSFDGIHYAGDVAYFMAMRLLNYVCQA
ncbi:hypothetical protein WJX74_010597 [Apatococcus lobatus]|uniref:Uncharacterized protein n=1 Tax=Apatococcus lobatus TaxID=904363 RepID=A0AAW1SF54_9CHLO